MSTQHTETRGTVTRHVTKEVVSRGIVSGTSMTKMVEKFYEAWGLRALQSEERTYGLCSRSLPAVSPEEGGGGGISEIYLLSPLCLLHPEETLALAPCSGISLHISPLLIFLSSLMGVWGKYLHELYYSQKELPSRVMFDPGFVMGRYSVSLRHWISLSRLWDGSLWHCPCEISCVAEPWRWRTYQADAESEVLSWRSSKNTTLERASSELLPPNITVIHVLISSCAAVSAQWSCKDSH